LNRLVERLLVAASIKAETHTRPRVRGIDLAVVIEGIAEQFRPEAPLHSFEVKIEPRLPRVLADPQAIDQVLQHLVDNAVKYSPAGGTIRLLAHSGQRSVNVLVEDEGVGLPSDHAHIFDKFEQGESVTKRVHDEGGVGLGLYIVRTLVEEMGGSVRAEPRPVVGARFIVSLRPAARSASRSTVAADV
jgi:signal transduction histidine kinase